MTDIFISYKRDDRPRAADIAARLQVLGLDVWYDARLEAGESFDEEIERQVTAASCVLVLWSAASVTSRWVRNEVSAGREGGKLAALKITPCTLPLEFKDIHCEELYDPDFPPNHPGWLNIIRRIERLLRRTLVADRERPSPSRSDNRLLQKAPKTKGPSDSDPRQQEFANRTLAERARGMLWRKLAGIRTAVGDSHKTKKRLLLPGDLFQDFGAGPTMVVVPGGTFIMGSPDEEVARTRHEEPRRPVTIPKPLAISQHPITFAEWDAYKPPIEPTKSAKRILPPKEINIKDVELRQYGYPYPGFEAKVTAVDWPKVGAGFDNEWGRNRKPLICVSYEDAGGYVRWLSERTGKVYRLLTEAEWEYSCRAGTDTPFFTGSNIGPTEARFGMGEQVKKMTGLDGSVDGSYATVQVGSFSKNAFGLHDMHGNVWEIVEDLWNDSYDEAPCDGGAWMKGDNTVRVMRGGSWNSEQGQLRSSARAKILKNWRFSDVGFRVAREL